MDKPKAADPNPPALPPKDVAPQSIPSPAVALQPEVIKPHTVRAMADDPVYHFKKFVEGYITEFGPRSHSIKILPSDKVDVFKTTSLVHPYEATWRTWMLFSMAGKTDESFEMEINFRAAEGRWEMMSYSVPKEYQPLSLEASVVVDDLAPLLRQTTGATNTDMDEAIKNGW